MELLNNKKGNPYVGYLERFKKEEKKINPVHEIVKTYFELRGIDKRPASFYKGRHSYPKLAKEAKTLYTDCNENIEDALWSLDKMKYKADKGRFDWSIITCLKHKLI